MSIRPECHSDAVKLMKMDETIHLNEVKRLVELFVHKKHLNKLPNTFSAVVILLCFSHVSYLGVVVRSGRYQNTSFSEKTSVTNNEDLSSCAWDLSMKFRTWITSSKDRAIGT